MNITLKRIISMILVFTMLLSMPGCATIDGRPASFFEVVFWIAGSVLQITALVVGELVLFVIFAVIDFIMRGIESVTGGDWWVVEDVGGPIMRGYGRLIDPKGRFGDWSEEVETTEPEGTTPATVPETTAPETTVPETTAPETEIESDMPQTGETEENLPIPESAEGTIRIVFMPNGGYREPDDQIIKVGAWFPKLTEEIPANLPGQQFLGWGRTPDATEVAFMPGDSLRGVEQSMYLYAMWRTCTEHTYFMDKENDGEILCQDCRTPIPMEKLKFSVFLKYFYPKKDPAKLKQKQKEEALDDYIRIKTLMTKNELYANEYALIPEKKTELNMFEKVALGNDIFTFLLKTTTLQETDAFFLSFTAMSVIVDDVGMENLTGKIVTGLVNVTTASSAVNFVTASLNASQKAKNYISNKEKGIENIYYTKKAYRELAIANVESLAALASFVGNFGSYSLGAPQAELDDLTKELDKLAEKQELLQIYYDLYNPYGNTTDDVSELTINDALANRGIKEQFMNPKLFSEDMITESIYAAMKWGPSSTDFAKLIPDILSKTIPARKAAVATAMWYYYGFRVQYEYECFIQDILNDRI